MELVTDGTCYLQICIFRYGDVFVCLLWNDALNKAIERRILDNVEGTDPGGYFRLEVMSLRGILPGRCCP